MLIFRGKDYQGNKIFAGLFGMSKTSRTMSLCSAVKRGSVCGRRQRTTYTKDRDITVIELCHCAVAR